MDEKIYLTEPQAQEQEPNQKKFVLSTKVLVLVGITVLILEAIIVFLFLNINKTPTQGNRVVTSNFQNTSITPITTTNTVKIFSEPTKAQGGRSVTRPTFAVDEVTVTLLSFNNGTLEKSPTFVADTDGNADNPIISRVTKDGKIFYIHKHKIYEFNLLTQKSTFLREIHPNSTLAYAAIYVTADNTILVQQIPRIFGDEHYNYYFDEFDLTNMNFLQEIFIPEVDKNIYQLRYLFTDNNAYYIVSEPGIGPDDECSSAGAVYKYINNTATVVMNIGGNCFPEPWFIGEVKKDNSLILLRTKQDLSGSAEVQKYIPDNIYRHNVLTGAEQTLVDLTTFPEKVLFARLSENEEDVLVYAEAGIWLVSLHSGEKEKISNTLTEGYISYVDNKYLFYSSLNETRDRVVGSSLFTLSDGITTQLSESLAGYLGHHGASLIFYSTEPL